VRLGRLLLRTTIGALFVGHGTQKLFGWFEGPGLEGTAQGFHAVGLRPGRRNAALAGLGEAAGGSMLMIGAWTPLAASALIASMLTAIRAVHWPNGVWNTRGGFEYNLTLITALLAIVEVGPGPISVDAARGREHRGTGWALAALATGAAASTAAIELARRTPETAPAVSEPPLEQPGEDAPVRAA
jgi:putative oxidoreductase